MLVEEIRDSSLLLTFMLLIATGHEFSSRDVLGSALLWKVEQRRETGEQTRKSVNSVKSKLRELLNCEARRASQTCWFCYQCHWGTGLGSESLL